MTFEELQEILTKPPEEVLKALQVSSYSIAKWDDLRVQYNPLEHSIMDTTLYPEKINANEVDDFKRTVLPLQKLAVSRIAQSMFVTPTERTYNYDKESESQQKAVDILEQLYKVENYIDSENIERGKQVNATCQIVTIWKVYEKELIIKEEISKFTLTHKTYSEQFGYKIYAIKDDNDNLLVVSILYKDESDKEIYDIYVGGEKPEYIQYVKEDDWTRNEEISKDLEIFPAVYTWLSEPVWGGDAGTLLVEQLEEMESYQGMYIKRNSLPVFTQDMGDTSNMTTSTTEENPENVRNIIKLGKGGSMEDITWEGAGEAINTRYIRLRNAFFEQVQMPDISFANMINSRTSAENKELLFSDAKAKALDLGGEWTKMFYEELNIVKEFAKVMFTGIAKDLETITVRSTIIPYSLKTKLEKAEYVALAGDSMSLETRVRELGEVDDVQQEVKAIENERGANNNLL